MPHDDITQWDPAKILQDSEQHPEYALLVLNQPIESRQLLELVWQNTKFRIAADGAANRLFECFGGPVLQNSSKKLDAICGDLDSLTEDVRKHFEAQGTAILEDPDQESTDFTKCINYLRSHVFSSSTREAVDIICLGGLGGRVDQGMSQLHHLLMFQEGGYRSGRIYLLSTEAITFVLKAGHHAIRLKPASGVSILGKHVGILPLKGPASLTTKGLEWDVSDWLTQFGGQVSTSNHVRAEVVQIFTTEDVLFTIDLSLSGTN